MDSRPTKRTTMESTKRKEWSGLRKTQIQTTKDNRTGPEPRATRIKVVHETGVIRRGGLATCSRRFRSLTHLHLFFSLLHISMMAFTWTIMLSRISRTGIWLRELSYRMQLCSLQVLPSISTMIIMGIGLRRAIITPPLRIS